MRQLLSAARKRILSNSKQNFKQHFPLFSRVKHFTNPEITRVDYPNQVLMLLTDAGGSMRRLGTMMQNSHDFEKMLHVTCMAHAVHNVIHRVSKAYPDVDTVIMSIKDVFSLSKSKLQTFKRLAVGVKRPPAPVITRFGKWQEAAMYYGDANTRVAVLEALEYIRSEENQKPQQSQGKI